METDPYAEFSARLHEGVVRQRIPVNVIVEITRLCPLACVHCYNNLPMADHAARSAELTYLEHCRLLDQLADIGCLWLLYTGGEIFARGDFLEIYKYAKGKGFIITLFTNATMITPEIADTLADWRPFEVEVTLYGRTRETYERLTGVPGSYDRCLRGIRLLQERGIPVTVKTVAVAINRHELWDMKRFVEQELGLRFRFDAMMTPRIDCAADPLAVRLTPEEIVGLDLLDSGRMQEWQDFSCRFIGPQQAPGHEADLYHCGAGVNTFAVDPTGLMSTCILTHRQTFDLRKGTVEEGWNGILAKVREAQITRATKCTTCQLKSVCGMCPANAELEEGDPETPVHFLCELAHLRALTFGWPIPSHGPCERLCEEGAKRRGLTDAADRLREKAPRDGEPGPALGPSAVPAEADGAQATDSGGFPCAEE